jgi:hypothetical protein
MKKIAVVCLLLLSSCCGIDTAADRKNLALAERCADGWFQDLPVTEEDQRLVRNALQDWRNAIEAAEGKK